jgi:16S rRNA (uracil1498-N3)-methyltransferase
MNRILFEFSEVDEAGMVAIADHRARHCLAVLKATVGQSLRVGIIDGPRGVGTVEQIDGARIRLRCAWEETQPAAARIDLLLALPRPKVLKRLWAPLASLGVGRVILTNAAKVERNYFDTHWLEAPFYRPLLIEGAAQAGDTRLPEVHIFRQFRPLVEDCLGSLGPPAVRVAAHPSATARVRDLAMRAEDRVLLAVGPEGGWTDFELGLLAGQGFVGVNLGPRTLRTDVACMALIALVQDRLS